MTERIPPTEHTQQQYAAWLHHPMTKFVMQYLGDFAEALELGVQKGWKAGTLELATEKEARGRVLVIDEITTLKWDAIMKFYGIEPEPTEEEDTDVGDTNSGRNEQADQ